MKAFNTFYFIEREREIENPSASSLSRIAAVARAGPGWSQGLHPTLAVGRQGSQFLAHDQLSLGVSRELALMGIRPV